MSHYVVFSERAYTSLLSETLGKITTETGGIFLGTFEDNKWYIIESIDPGPKSIFSVAYFEYDEAYVNHLANKINKLYEKPLQIMGLWHRHPGSMDFFSSTDNGTHQKYLNINQFGFVSALVNIDPAFRISIYHISHNNGRMVIHKTKIPYSVGDKYIPKNFLSYKPAEFLHEKIRYNALWGIDHKKNSKPLASLIKKVFSSSAVIQDSNSKPFPVSDDDIDKILEAFQADFDFFEENGIVCNMSRTKENVLKFFGEMEQDLNSCMEVFVLNDIIYIRHNRKTLQYKDGLFSRAYK